MATTDAVRLKVTRYLQKLAADNRDHATLRLKSSQVARELKLPALSTRHALAQMGAEYGLEKLRGGAAITEFNFHPAQMKAAPSKRTVQHRGTRARVLGYLQRQPPGSVVSVHQAQEALGVKTDAVRSSLLYFAKLSDFDVTKLSSNIYRVGQVGQSANGHAEFVVDRPPETQPGREGKDAEYDKALAAEFAAAVGAGVVPSPEDEAAADRAHARSEARFNQALTEFEAALPEPEFAPEPESVKAGHGTPPHMVAELVKGRALAPWEAPGGWTVRYLTTTSAGVVLVEDGEKRVYALRPVDLG